MPRNRPLIEEPNEITLTEQDDIQQILGHPPGWILRWGVTILIVIVGLLLTLSWLIKYPDVITANVELTSEYPVIPLVAKKSGQLSILEVSNQEKVDSGDVLAILENAANYADIKRLEKLLDQTIDMGEAEILGLSWPSKLILGDLQPTYASFTQRINDYIFFGGQQAVFNKIKSLRAQIEYIDSLNASLDRQLNTLKEEKTLAQKKLARDSTLVPDGVSPEELEATRATVLSFDRRLEIINTQIIDNDVRKEVLQVQIIDLNQNWKEDKNFKELSIQEFVDRLKGQLDIWKQQNALIAPIDGEVVFTTIWSPNQFVETGQVVISIIPEGGLGNKYGRAEMPIAGSGKVKFDLDVNISLFAYPTQEFGLLRGKVRRIAPIPSNYSNYLVEIELPDTLITTYKDTIPFQQQLLGSAEIITEDRRLIERFFDKILDMIRN